MICYNQVVRGEYLDKSDETENWFLFFCDGWELSFGVGVCCEKASVSFFYKSALLLQRKHKQNI